MDGKRTPKSDRSTGISCRRTGAVVLAAIAVGGMLVSFSGCAVTRTALTNAMPEAGPGVGQPHSASTAVCMCAGCAAPQTVVAERASIQTESTSGIVKMQSDPPSLSAVPPAASLPAEAVPDFPIQTSTGWPAAQQLRCPPAIETTSHPPVPAVPASEPELSQCRKQMEELNDQIGSLKETTERAQLAMQVMAVEQTRMQMQNELLLRRVEKTDRQYLESMESLSQIIGEVIASSAEATAPVPSSSASSQEPDEDSRAILLPSVDDTP